MQNPPIHLQLRSLCQNGHLHGGTDSPSKVPRIEVSEIRAPTQHGEGAKKRAQSSTKVQRIGTISEALAQIQDFARNGDWERQIASVLDLLDTQLDPKEIEKAREVQMATLVEKDFAVPKLKQDFSKKSKLFH